VALILSVSVGILTLGIPHAICALFFNSKKISHNQKPVISNKILTISSPLLSGNPDTKVDVNEVRSFFKSLLMIASTVEPDKSSSHDYKELERTLLDRIEQKKI